MIDQWDIATIWGAAGMLLVLGFFLNRMPVWVIGSREWLCTEDLRIQRAGVIIMAFSILTGTFAGFMEMAI